MPRGRQTYSCQGWVIFSRATTTPPGSEIDEFMRWCSALLPARRLNVYKRGWRKGPSQRRQALRRVHPIIRNGRNERDEAEAPGKQLQAHHGQRLRAARKNARPGG